MENEELDKLIELRGRIEGLKAVKCRVVHERVRLDKESGLPLTRNIFNPVYVRIGLCPPEIRAGMISCGHTMARYALEDALSLLPDSAGKQALRDELSGISDGIHALDHQRGDAEKYLAELIEKKHLTPEDFSEKEFERTTARIRSLEQKHSEYVDRIAAVREKILAEIQAVIANNPKSKI